MLPKAACPAGYFRIAASPAATERSNHQRVASVVRPSNRTPHAPTPSPRFARVRTWWKFTFAAILGIAAAGQTQSASAGECTGQILKVVKKDISMTMLEDDAGALKNANRTKKGSTMKMPLCVLHFDKKKSRYRIRLSDGAEALLNRRYVLDSTNKPPIVINCDGDTIYKTSQAGGVRGSGEDPCD